MPVSIRHIKQTAFLNFPYRELSHQNYTGQMPVNVVIFTKERNLGDSLNTISSLHFQLGRWQISADVWIVCHQLQLGNGDETSRSQSLQSWSNLNIIIFDIRNLLTEDSLNTFTALKEEAVANWSKRNFPLILIISGRNWWYFVIADLLINPHAQLCL